MRTGLTHAMRIFRFEYGGSEVVRWVDKAQDEVSQARSAGTPGQSVGCGS